MRTRLVRRKFVAALVVAGALVGSSTAGAAIYRPPVVEAPQTRVAAAEIQAQAQVSKADKARERLWKCQQSLEIPRTKSSGTYRTSPSARYREWAIKLWDQRADKCESHLKALQRLEADFHKSLRTAALLNGVSYDWLHNCAHGEGGHGPAFVWNTQGSGAFGPFQFMQGTFYGYVGSAMAHARTKGFIIPSRYHRWDSIIGQTFTAAYMFGRGLSSHWVAPSC